MSDLKDSHSISPHKRLLVFSAWVMMLLVSDLPDIIWSKVVGQIPGWLFWSKIGILVVSLGMCLVWKRIRPLWQFACVFLVFYAALGSTHSLKNMSWWQNLHSRSQISFTLGYLEIYIRDLGIAILVIAALWIIKRRRNDFFLTKGQTSAPVESVRWLGIKQGESWRKLGWIIASIAGLGLLIPTMLIMRPSWETLSRAAPLLPSVLLFAGINAFTEETYYRLSILSTLCNSIGKSHTLLINAVFFGLAHYLYGSPPGVLGFLLTGVLAWFLGKSILETRGLLWAWFIHFIPDVVIFASYALDWVKR